MLREKNMIIHDTADQFAICLNNTEYPASLERHKLYQIVPDEEAALDGDLRIIDESGEDYLYPAEYFVVVDFPDSTEYILQESFTHAFQMA
jgi:hypothetical protein